MKQKYGKPLWLGVIKPLQYLKLLREEWQRWRNMSGRESLETLMRRRKDE